MTSFVSLKNYTFENVVGKKKMQVTSIFYFFYHVQSSSLNLIYHLQVFSVLTALKFFVSDKWLTVLFLFHDGRYFPQFLANHQVLVTNLFSFSPQCFQKHSFPGLLNVGIVLEDDRDCQRPLPQNYQGFRSFGKGVKHDLSFRKK